MEALGRFELPTCGLGNRRSIHLSYRATYTHYIRLIRLAFILVGEWCRYLLLQSPVERAVQSRFTSFFNTFRPNPSGHHMVSRMTATFRTRSGTRQVLELPAGKNAKSPGPNRRSWPSSVVMKTSPETITTTSSWRYRHLNVPPVHSHTTTCDVQSRLLTTLLILEMGVPLKTQFGDMGISSAESSKAVGLAITISLGMFSRISAIQPLAS